jgi:hypothetical protein
MTAEIGKGKEKAKESIEESRGRIRKSKVSEWGSLRRLRQFVTVGGKHRDPDVHCKGLAPASASASPLCHTIRNSLRVCESSSLPTRSEISSLRLVAVRCRAFIQVIVLLRVQERVEWC